MHFFQSNKYELLGTRYSIVDKLQENIMSRTYRRKDSESFAKYNKVIISFWRATIQIWQPYENTTNNHKGIAQAKAKYYGDHGYKRRFGDNGSFPKEYRKFVNKQRKEHDRIELYRELHIEDYSPVYSKWNCKDSDPMWYW